MELKVGETIDPTKIGCRGFDPNETIKCLKMFGGTGFWCWGAHAYTVYKDTMLRFKVSGLKHKGHVYITLNGADLYDVALTTTKGKIKKVMTDIYFDDLFNLLDWEIETNRPY